MIALFSVLRRQPCRAFGYTLLLLALGTGATSVTKCPLMDALSQILRSDRFTLKTNHGVLLAASGVAASLAILFVSTAIGAGQHRTRTARVALLFDMIAIFMAMAWVAMLTTLCCFLMLIGSG